MSPSSCLSFFLVFAIVVSVHGQKPECERYLQDANAAEKKGEYRSAILFYNAALVCDPAQKNEVDKKILAVFDRIDAQKKEAIQAKKQLDIAKKQVEQERDRAVEARQEAQRQALLAEKASMASQNVALALQTIATNPTLALRLAETNRKLFPDNSAASATYYRILGDSSLFFYQTNLQLGAKILCIAISADGKSAAAGLENGNIALWNPVEKQPQVKFIRAHRNREIRALKFSPDGKLLLSAGADRTAKLWNFSLGISDSACIRTFDKRSEALNVVAFSTDGKELALGYEGGLVQIRSVTGPDTLVLETNYRNGLNTITFTPDAEYLLAGGDDDMVWIWKKSDLSKPFKVLQGHIADVRSAEFSPDGNLLLISSRDKTASLWDWKNADKPFQIFEGHPDALCFATFLPGAKKILTGGEDNTVKLWELDGRKEALATFRGHSSSVRGVAFGMSDATTFWSAGQDSTVKRWSLAVRPKSGKSWNVHEGALNVMRSDAASGKVFSGGVDGKIASWMPDDPATAPVYIQAHDMGITDLSITPGAGIVASCGQDSLVKIWDFTATDSRPRYVLPKFRSAVTTLAISSDGHYMATASLDSLAYLWNLDAPTKPPVQIAAHRGMVTALAFSPDGLMLAVGSEDNLARLWKISREAQPKLLHTFYGHAARVTGLFFSPDGKTLFTASADATIRRYKLAAPETPENIFVFSKKIYDTKLRVAFSPNFTEIAASHENLLKLWQTDGVEQPFWADFGQKLWVLSVEFAPSGASILAGYEDGHVESWVKPDFFASENVAEIPFQQLIKTGLRVQYDSLLDSPDAGLLSIVGEALYRQNDFSKAKLFWERANKLAPKPENMVGLYKTEKRLGIDRAEMFLATDSLPVLDAFGQYFLRMGEWDMAYRFYEKINRLRPRDVQSLIKLYETALRSGQPFELDLFLNLNDRAMYDRTLYYLNNSLGFNSVSTCWEQRIALYENLLQIFDKARSLDSAFFSTDDRLWRMSTWCTNLAELYASRGDYPRAMQSLDRAMAYDPTWWVIYVMKPRYLILTGRFEEAKEFYLKKAPDKYNPKKGIPLYRDKFLLDLQDFEKSGKLSPLQRNKVMEIKVLLKGLP